MSDLERPYDANSDAEEELKQVSNALGQVTIPPIPTALQLQVEKRLHMAKCLRKHYQGAIYGRYGVDCSLCASFLQLACLKSSLLLSGLGAALD